MGKTEALAILFIIASRKAKIAETIISKNKTLSEKKRNEIICFISELPNEDFLSSKEKTKRAILKSTKLSELNAIEKIKKQFK